MSLRRANQTEEATTRREEVLGLTRITKQKLKELCKRDKLYQTPGLNDTLYLHFQGFQNIECLEDYTELKCLWLDSNAISDIEGLTKQSKLRCLFLQNNLVKRIQNLESCRDLDTLNLSYNHIRKIENCNKDVLPVLNSLFLQSNYLKDAQDLSDLVNCPSISVLDLANNRIDDITVVKIFAQMPNLRVLVLNGNPVVSKIPQYRRTLTLECKELTYLDSRPVFPKDRACAEAWKRGGYEEERKEHDRWIRADRKRIRDSVNATIRLRNRSRPDQPQTELLCSSDEDESEEAITKRRREFDRLQTQINVDLDIWDEVNGQKAEDPNGSSDSSNSDEEPDDPNDDIFVPKVNKSKKDKSGAKKTKKSKVEEITEKNQEISGEDGQESDEDVVQDDEKNVFDSDEDINESTLLSLEELKKSNKKLKSMMEDDIEKLAAAGSMDNICTLIADRKQLSADQPPAGDDALIAAGHIEIVAAWNSSASDAEQVENEIEGIMKKCDEINKTPLIQEVTDVPELIADDREDVSYAGVLMTEEQIKRQRECDECNRKTEEELKEFTNNMSEFVTELHNAEEERNEGLDGLYDSDSDTENKVDELPGVVKIEQEVFEKVAASLFPNEQLIDVDCSEIRALNLTAEDLAEVPDEPLLEFDNSQSQNTVVKAWESKEKRQMPYRLQMKIERDTAELRQLLQKLEDENERLYPSIEDDSSVKIVKDVLHDFISNLELKQKCFEFTDLESDEEYSYTAPPEPPEQPVKCIRDVMGDFKKLLHNISKQYKDEMESEEREYKQRAKVATTPKEKAESMQYLLNSRNIKEFHEGTKETLDERITNIEVRKQERLKKMVHRVYAKKDLYDNTLELMDRKLVVVTKDTGDIAELPQRHDYDSSNDSDGEAMIKDTCEKYKRKTLQQLQKANNVSMQVSNKDMNVDTSVDNMKPDIKTYATKQVNTNDIDGAEAIEDEYVNNEEMNSPIVNFASKQVSATSLSQFRLEFTSELTESGSLIAVEKCIIGDVSVDDDFLNDESVDNETVDDEFVDDVEPENSNKPLALPEKVPPFTIKSLPIESDDSDCDQELANVWKNDKMKKPLNKDATPKWLFDYMEADYQNKPIAIFDDTDSDSDEDFYSARSKCSDFIAGIDKNFFDSLDFGILPDEDSDADEVQPVKCTRSYEELRHFVSQSEPNRVLTKEEEDMVEQMLRNAEVNEPEGLKSTQREKEDELLEKMVERQKAFEAEELAQQVAADAAAGRLFVLEPNLAMRSRGGGEVGSSDEKDIAGMSCREFIYKNDNTTATMGEFKNPIEADADIESDDDTQYPRKNFARSFKKKKSTQFDFNSMDDDSSSDSYKSARAFKVDIMDEQPTCSKYVKNTKRKASVGVWKPKIPSGTSKILSPISRSDVFKKTFENDIQRALQELENNAKHYDIEIKTRVRKNLIEALGAMQNDNPVDEEVLKVHVKNFLEYESLRNETDFKRSSSWIREPAAPEVEPRRYIPVPQTSITEYVFCSNDDGDEDKDHETVKENSQNKIDDDENKNEESKPIFESDQVTLSEGVIQPDLDLIENNEVVNRRALHGTVQENSLNEIDVRYIDRAVMENNGGVIRIRTYHGDMEVSNDFDDSTPLLDQLRSVLGAVSPNERMTRSGRDLIEFNGVEYDKRRLGYVFFGDENYLYMDSGIRTPKTVFADVSDEENNTEPIELESQSGQKFDEEQLESDAEISITTADEPKAEAIKDEHEFDKSKDVLGTDATLIEDDTSLNSVEGETPKALQKFHELLPQLLMEDGFELLTCFGATLSGDDTEPKPDIEQKLDDFTLETVFDDASVVLSTTTVDDPKDKDIDHTEVDSKIVNDTQGQAVGVAEDVEPKKRADSSLAELGYYSDEDAEAEDYNVPQLTTAMNVSVPHTEILECTLEILDGNDDDDTVFNTVNATTEIIYNVEDAEP